MKPRSIKKGKYANREVPRFLYRCPCCMASFNFKKLFEIHLEQFHKDEKEMQCMECSRTEEGGLQLAHHIVRDHVRMSNVPCHICGADFDRSFDFNTHVLTVHSNTCPACYQTFTERSKVHLNQHDCKYVDINSHELPSATCYKCRMFFPDKTMLPEHLETCSKFQCVFCSRSYAIQEGLVSHYRREHPKKEAKPQDCKKCVLLSGNEAELAKHLETEHSSEDFGTGNFMKHLYIFHFSSL